MDGVVRHDGSARDAQEVVTRDGFGARTAKNILDAIVHEGVQRRRFDRRAVSTKIDALAPYLWGVDGTEVSVAGSFRRRRETIGDVDLLVGATSAARVVDWFTRYSAFKRVTVRGFVRATAYLEDDLQVDLRVVQSHIYGAALLYFTGSKVHNIDLRRIARTKGLKLNEYGLFRGNRMIAGATEQSIYRGLHLRWVPPADREGIEEL